jgi:CubicO group peptidase (beta-lactamase class C family)
MKAFFHGAALACALAAAAPAAGAPLDRELAQLQAGSELPGFCVALVDAGGLRYRNGFGYADLETKRPYTADTVQPVASVSKTLIGVALMKAVELGYFTLDTDVGTLLPFKVANPAYPGRPITLRQLATHTSGITDREDVYEKAYEPGARPRTALKDFLADYFGEKGRYYSRRNFTAQAPGEAYHYSNLGAALAAYAIEVKAGVSYADFTRKYVFDPVGMSASGWSTDEARKDNARLYGARRKPYPVYSLATYPDGGLHTSCTDLGRYLGRVIAGLRGADAQGGLLAQASFRTMLAAQFDQTHMPPGFDAKHPNQGLFWEFLRDGEIGHYGGDPGVSTFMAFDPDTGVGRILLANVGGEDAMTAELAGQIKRIWTTLQAHASETAVR